MEKKYKILAGIVAVLIIIVGIAAITTIDLQKETKGVDEPQTPDVPSVPDEPSVPDIPVVTAKVFENAKAGSWFNYSAYLDTGDLIYSGTATLTVTNNSQTEINLTLSISIGQEMATNEITINWLAWESANWRSGWIMLTGQYAGTPLEKCIMYDENQNSTGYERGVVDHVIYKFQVYLADGTEMWFNLTEFNLVVD